MVLLAVSASLAEIPPFFEPGAPPPTLPILLAQTEVGSVISPPKLLAEEEIGTGPILVRSLVKSRPAPYQRHSTAGPLNSAVVLDTESRGRDFDDSDQDSESSDDETLIPKPNGEAGRPGRGGYNLEDALGWHAKEYSRFKVESFLFKILPRY